MRTGNTLLQWAVLLLLQILLVRCQHLCPEDGLYPNPEDETSYFECIEGKSHLWFCPKNGRGVGMVFNGQTCVLPIDEPMLIWESDEVRAEEFKEEDEEQRAGRVGRAVSHYFVCPQSFGIFDDPDNRHQYYQCSQGKPIRKFQCPVGTHLNSYTLKCMGTDLVSHNAQVIERPMADEPVYETGDSYAINQPRVEEIERNPQIQELYAQETYEPMARAYPGRPLNSHHYGRQLRRNGRVETEDESGTLYVDIWDEKRCIWVREYGGQRTLDDRNGWTYSFCVGKDPCYHPGPGKPSKPYPTKPPPRPRPPTPPKLPPVPPDPPKIKDPKGKYYRHY